MTPADHRLAATAACLAGPRAAALLARGPSAEAAAEAARLATRPREDRLRALAAALEGALPANLGERARQAASQERPRVAALVTRLGRGGSAGHGPAAALIRIVRERLAR